MKLEDIIGILLGVVVSGFAIGSLPHIGPRAGMLLACGLAAALVLILAALDASERRRWR